MGVKSDDNLQYRCPQEKTMAEILVIAYSIYFHNHDLYLKNNFKNKTK